VGMVSIVDGEGEAVEGVTGVEVCVFLSVSLVLLLSTFDMNRSTSSSTYSYSCISGPAVGGRSGKTKIVPSSNDDIPCSLWMKSRSPANSYWT